MRRHTGRRGRLRTGIIAATAILVGLFGLDAVRADAPDAAHGDTARNGEGLARSAAASWASDARLIYVENDETLTGDGRAERWGFLFYSPSLDAARAYSVRGSKIVTASHVPFDFAAPPLPGAWIDSGEALAAAEEKGRAYREEHGGHIRAMFLVRGLMYTDDPDLPTWAVVYDSAQVPGLWVVVNARSGEVVRTWRG